MIMMASLIDQKKLFKEICFGGEGAHNQPVDPQVTSVKEGEEQGSGVALHVEYEETTPRAPGKRGTPKTRRLHCRPYDDPQEAEFGFAEDRPRAPYQWD